MSNPIKTVFTDAVGTDIPSNGNSVKGGNYDQFSDLASGSADTGGHLGKILTSYTIQGVGEESKPDAGVGEYKARYE